MDTTLLEYFLRIAELGSINKAAADLNLSQPALSRHVSTLEHELGVQLFRRSRAGVALTDEGQLLSDRARPLLRQFAIMKEQIGEKPGGQVAVGIPTSWQSIFTIPFAEEMIRRFPNIALRVHEGVSHILRDHMFAGLLDLCVVPFATELGAGYRQTALVREPLVLVGDKALHKEEPRTISDLDGLNFILPGRPNVLRTLVEHALGRKGLKFRIAVETDTLALCLDLARRGNGFTIVPACAVFKADPRLSWAPVRSLSMTWALCENLARSHSPAVRETKRLIQSTVANALARKEWYGGASTR